METLLSLSFVFGTVFLRLRPIECWIAKIRTKEDGLVRFWICEYQKIYHTFNRVVHGSPTWGQLTQVGTLKFNESSWCATTICSRPSGFRSNLPLDVFGFRSSLLRTHFSPKFRNIIAGEYIKKWDITRQVQWCFQLGVHLYDGPWSGSLRTASFGPATLR